MNDFKLKIEGLKCDECGYRVPQNIPFKKYAHWVNKKCPNCGAPLLTLKDFLSCCLLQIMVNCLNKRQNQMQQQDGQKFKMRLDMNGTGCVRVKSVEFDDNTRR